MSEINLDHEVFLQNLYGEVPEIMRHLWTLLPFGHEIELSNGRKGVLKRFIEPRERDGTWEFGFDVVFNDGAAPDHLEFMLKHTGGGGMVMAPSAAPVGMIGSA